MSIKLVSDFISKTILAKYKGRPKIAKPLKNCLLDLQKYINETVDEYLGTIVYSDHEIAEFIYNESIPNGDNEKFVKINLYAAKRTLNNIVAEISNIKGGLSARNIKLYCELINDFISDINDFINYYRRKTDPKFVFLSGIKFYSTSSSETFNVAHQLFYTSVTKNRPLRYKESQGMVSMVLRQSIEIKTKRIFGIDKIHGVGKKPQDYGFKRLFIFIEKNKESIDYNPIDFEVLKLIYKWSCTYIHNGETSYLWQSESALNYLKTFFAAGDYTDSNRKISSVYGAFKLSNFYELRSNLVEFIGTNYKVEFLPNDYVESLIVSY